MSRIERTRDGAFTSYDSRNPEIYASFKALALWLWGKGIRSYSVQDMFAILRFQVRLEAVVMVAGEAAPVPTMTHLGVTRTFFVFYARKLIEEMPQYEKFFAFKD